MNSSIKHRDRTFQIRKNIYIFKKMDNAKNFDNETDRRRSKSSNENFPESKDRNPTSNPRKIGKRRRSRRFAIDDLPSPPPNPRKKCPNPKPRATITDPRSNDRRPNDLAMNDAFDHLDKLHSMLDEILNVRDRSAKLFRRVRELERVRATRKAHSEIESRVMAGQDPSLPDEDVGFAESLLGAMLASSYEIAGTSHQSPNSNNDRTNRNRSIVVEPRRVSYPVVADSQTVNPSRSGQRIHEIISKRPSLAAGTPKISKWTRVKAAFKWEKAGACTAHDVNLEPDVRYLRIPDNAGGSSEISGPPTPAGTISSSSSIDDVFHRSNRPSSHQSARITRRNESSDPSRRSRSLDGEASVPMTFVYNSRTRSKDNACLQGKSTDPRSHKTPWGKVKDMMQLRRDSLGKQTMRNASRNDDAHSISSIESSDIHRSEQIDGRPPRVRVTADSTLSLATTATKTGTGNAINDFVDLASRRLTPTLTITVPSSEELRSISSPESITPPPPSRQNFESGKSDRYSQSGYDTSREIRTGQISPASSSSGILRYGLGRSKTCQGVPFAGDYKRQQSLKGESLSSSPKMHRRDSKWDKVKRAFLTSATSVPTSPSRISSYFFDDGDATGGSYSASASAEDLDNDGPSNPGAQAEIQRNYRLLHDKLGTEFYRKLAEWEKLKTGNNRDTARSTARDRDNENLRLLGEDRLTPEFKKKLDEWKRMNKTGNDGRSTNPNESSSRSVNRRRITDWQLWRSSSKPDSKPDSPRLSDDFIKKMEEWKRMKSAAVRRDADPEEESQSTREERRPEVRTEDEDEEESGATAAGIKLTEERRRVWKSLEDEEFRSLERVLEAMEIDRQTRLSKLQRIVGSLPQRTQEVLIHTSTGLYRFEGISRKFTRKLYEWEKSQGISPELSTFRLLDPLRHGVGSLRSRETHADSPGVGARRRGLYRSKSVGSVHTNSWRTTREHEKPAIRRPTSLSLNDMDNLKARSCIVASSVPTFPEEEDTSEDIAMEDWEADPEHEPEAVIVDIEDVIEETASPLRKYQPHQTPVYSVAGSETTSIAIPLGTVTARHEPSPVILIEPGEACPLNNLNRSVDRNLDISNHATASNSTMKFDSTFSTLTTENRQRRFVVGNRRTKRDNRDDYGNELSTIGNVGRRGRGSEAAREAGTEKTVESGLIGQAGETDENTVLRDSGTNWQMAHLSHALDGGPENLESPVNEDYETFEDAVVTVGSGARRSKKILKTRRLTDSQVGYDWRSIDRPTTSCQIPTDSFDAEATSEICSSPRPGDFEDNPNVERIIINEETINKIVVPTASSSATISSVLELDSEDQDHEMSPRKEKREPRSVYVKTKRIVFSSFRREEKKSAKQTVDETSNVIPNEECSIMVADRDRNYERSVEILKTDSRANDETIATSLGSSTESNASIVGVDATNSDADRRSADSKRPPVPRSPILARKDYRLSSSRETSPGVRMMIRRYNEKLENDADRNSTFATTTSLAYSSGSGSSSPSWRTPVTERRLTTPMERYDEAKKPVGTRNIRCNSCSASREHIADSANITSLDFLRQTSNMETRRYIENGIDDLSSLNCRIDDFSSIKTNDDLGSTMTIRAMKIRRAREDFLSKGPSMANTSDARSVMIAGASVPFENSDTREIAIAADVSASEDEILNAVGRVDLVKSASAGMINVDANTFERLQMAAAAATRVSDSLPRSNEHIRHPAATKEMTGSRFFQIARRFKKARLRRAAERETDNLSTVSMLCRQSLLVDIDGSAGSRATEDSAARDFRNNRDSPGTSRRQEKLRVRGDRYRDRDPKT